MSKSRIKCAAFCRLKNIVLYVCLGRENAFMRVKYRSENTQSPFIKRLSEIFEKVFLLLFGHSELLCGGQTYTREAVQSSSQLAQ